MEVTRTPVATGFSTNLPSFDFETYSEAGYFWDEAAQRWRGISNKSGIAAVGGAAYAEHPTTEVTELAYDLKDGIGKRLWSSGMPQPLDLFCHIESGGLLEAWNSPFEYEIWRNVCHGKMGWPELPLAQLRDAMAKGAVFGLPGGLDKATMVLGMAEHKLSSGKNLIKKLSCPRNPTKKNPLKRLTPESNPELFMEFGIYCLQDVEVTDIASSMIPDLSPFEEQVWLLDQKINARGVHIDMEGVEACREVVRLATDKYTTELRGITGIPDITVKATAQMAKWVTEHGYTMTSVDKQHVTDALADTRLPDTVRRVLEIRQLLSQSSISKLETIKNTTTRDSRLKGLFSYYGARNTGRFAGRGAQPQNLASGGLRVVVCDFCGERHSSAITCECGHPVPIQAKWDENAVDDAIESFKTSDLPHVEARWGAALPAVSACLRGLFTSAPGHDLICSDFSAIEAVVLAFMAGEKWRMDVFRTHGKIYEESVARITGKSFAEIMEPTGYDLNKPEWWLDKQTGEHHKLRKTLGKVAELASGYQGWIGAWQQFGADKFLSEDEIKDSINAWRAASPAIVEMWGGQYRKDPNRWAFNRELYGVEGAAVSAVLHPDTYHTYRDITYAYSSRDDILYCKLPSGRTLTYWRPRLREFTKVIGKKVSIPGIYELSFEFWNTDSSKDQVGWIRRGTYGGRLVENIIQAVARDILVSSMLKVEAAGYPIVLHVHDEIVSEVPHGVGSIEEFEKIMATMPDWCRDWPVRAAGGWRGKRYRKD